MAPGHAERPDRLRAINQHLAATGQLESFQQRTATALSLEALSAIHDADYLNHLKALSPAQGLVQVDPDTAMGPHSLNAARVAAGAVVDAVAQVLAATDRTDRTAFCAVRPPGHHAERDGAMGFCLLNSIALGAAAALASGQVARVAILDFDVHHGNGTVEIFQDRPEVLVCSSFQHPFYPHRYHDLVRPNIVNTPLPTGSTGSEFRRALEADWLPALDRHQPDLLLISAGFDAHRDDPLAGLNLDEADYRWVTELIMAAAERYSSRRVVSVLEGGYDLNALARSAATHLEVLAS